MIELEIFLLLFFLFYLHIYPSESEESVGGANIWGKQLPLTSFRRCQDIAVRLNFLFCFLVFIEYD